MDAQRVARRRSFFQCHKPARSARPPVKGKCRDQIESAQEAVGEGQIAEHSYGGKRKLYLITDLEGQIGGSAQNETGDRAGDRHQKLRLRTWRFLLHLRHTAEDKQHDAADRNSVVPGHQRVSQLVKDDRSKETYRPDGAHPPVGGVGQSFR